MNEYEKGIMINNSSIEEAISDWFRKKGCNNTSVFVNDNHWMQYFMKNRKSPINRVSVTYDKVVTIMKDVSFSHASELSRELLNEGIQNSGIYGIFLGIIHVCGEKLYVFLNNGKR